MNGPPFRTLPERIAYLEKCYMRDPISRDTRIQLAEQIEDLKRQLAQQSK